MIKPNKEDAVRMAAGAFVLILIFLFVFHFYQKENPAEQLALKANRVDLVSRMRIALASASEAEKSAVLAITNQDSQTFADQARAATAEVERERLGLEEQLRTGGTPEEKELLRQFSEFFAEYQRIDKELLDLAVKNTNIKAYDMAFGPAAAALQEMNAALSRLRASIAVSPEERRVMRLAYGIEIAGLSIQTLIPPHVAEESDTKMDELEEAMAKEDRQIRKNLAELASLTALKRNADLATAAAGYEQYSKIRAEILALSRENTNVRSLSISMNQKRKVMLLCQNTLDELQRAILAEPIAGVTYGRPPRPR
jgi:hypothetical protein